MSFLSSFLGGNIGFNDSTTNTSNQFNQQQNTNTSQNATGSTQKTLTPYQSAIQAPLFNQISQLMTNPTSYLAPFQTQAMDQTNSSYAGLSDALKQQFLGTTGGGSSGKFGSALAQGNLQRIGALQNVGTQFAQEASELPLTAASLATNLLGQNFGSTTTGSTTGTSASTASGTSSGSSSSSGFSVGIGGGGRT